MWGLDFRIRVCPDNGNLPGRLSLILRLCTICSHILGVLAPLSAPFVNHRLQDLPADALRSRKEVEAGSQFAV